MDCIFCQIDRTILAETKLSLAFFDGFPVSPGHSLVIPKRHVPTIWELSAEEYSDLFNLVREVKDMIQDQFEPQGINVGANCGQAAGQTVEAGHGPLGRCAGPRRVAGHSSRSCQGQRVLRFDMLSKSGCRCRLWPPPACHSSISAAHDHRGSSSLCFDDLFRWCILVCGGRES
jgi:hypothetical protein